MTDDLLKLAERCEREEPSRDLDSAIESAHRGMLAYTTYPSFYTTSLDAAVTLVPEGHWFSLTDWSTDSRACRSRVFPGNIGAFDFKWDYAKTPALALCAAALRARHALKAGT